MSILNVTTIRSANGTTDLTIGSGNTSSNIYMIVAANGAGLIFQSNSSSNVMVVNTSGITITNSNLNINNAAIPGNTFTIGTGSYFVANGNVGIGNSAPINKLSVNGTTYLGGDVTATGTITGNISGSAGSATNATYATSAGSATNATYATSAGSATNATSAGSATNATYATSAGSATNATYATSAGGLSGSGAISVGSITSSNTLTLSTVPFFRNTPTIAANYTVTGTYNEMSIGPITINDSVTVTINDGASWQVL